MHVLRQVGGRFDDSALLGDLQVAHGCGQRPGAGAHVCVHLEASSVDVTQSGPLVSVGDHQELPPLTVGPGRGLDCQLQTLPDQVVVDRAVEVKPLTH